MESFELRTKINFGEGSLESLKEIKEKNLLIVTDPFIVESGMINKITENLEGNSYKIFSGIVPDPSIEIIVNGIEMFEQIQPSVIIAIGGGSAIDAAKSIMDFARKIYKLKDIEFIAVPTTSGTGSEVTSFSVITDKEKGVKYPLVSDELLPNIAILDPTLITSVPNFITADTGIDVLTHAIEAYVSKSANDFTDALAEKTIKLVFSYLRRAYENGNDIKAREKMHNASCLAGIAFNKASLGLNHSIAHALGGKFKIPHGRANSILLTHVIEYNADIKGYNNSDFTASAYRYCEIAKLLNLNASNVRVGVKSLISEIKKLKKDLNMVTSLKECGVSRIDVERLENEISHSALNDVCTKTNPKEPTNEDIISIIMKI